MTSKSLCARVDDNIQLSPAIKTSFSDG